MNLSPTPAGAEGVPEGVGERRLLAC